MDPITLALAADLTADAPARIIRGKITRFGLVSESHGLKILSGALKPRLPLKRVKLLRDHDHAQPVGYMQEFSQAAEDADAAFYVPEGPDGDRALAEAENGLRDGMSVGFMPTDYEFDESGVLVVKEAELYEVSLCAIPAYQDAQVESVAAAVAKARTFQKGSTMDENENGQPAAVAAALSAPEGTPAAAPAAPAPAPAAGPAFRAAPAEFAAGGKQLTARQEFMLSIRENKNIQLALDPIIQADVFDPTTVPAFIGELWKGRGYRERYTGLVRHETLTAQKMTGWRWKDGMTPEVDDYAGNLAEVPTNEVQAESVDFSALRLASGHKVDRIHVDLPNPAFWDSFYRERATNYAKLIDGKVLTHINTAANHTAKTVTAGTDAWGKLYEGAQWVLEFAVPNFAIVGSDIYKELALSADADKLAFLNASLGLEEGSLAGFRIIGAPISAATLNGSVIIGSTDATELYQLPGGPIRVEALDVAHGGVDAGLFGYYALFTQDKRGVVKITEGA